MRILIIEDEPAAADRLEKLVLRHMPEARFEARIESVEEAVLWFSSNPHPDLIFLDIQLSDGLSFRIFEKTDVRVPVIFTTAYDAYALKAFELQSIDYLLKPVKEERLKEALEKYKTMARNFAWKDIGQDLLRIIREGTKDQRDYRKRILVNQADKLISVPIANISLFYSEDKASFLLRGDGALFFMSQSLDEIESQVDPEAFFRISRKHIVSREFISSVNQYFGSKLLISIATPNDQELIVSKARVHAFREWFGK